MKNAEHYFIFAFLFLFFSCTETEKQRIIRLVKEWDGKEVLFPNKINYTVCGKDTAGYAAPLRDYQIIMQNKFKIALVAAVALIAGFGVYNSQKEELALSDLMLENVEALARYELPEVEITCGMNDGRCWDSAGTVIEWTPFGPIRLTDCYFLGYTWVSCYAGMPA